MRPETALLMWRLIIISCVTLVLPLGGAQADDLTRKERITAKKLYDMKCMKCHRSYEPREYAEDEWRLWMAKMSKKSKLNPTQEKLLNRYLDDYRTQKVTPKLGSQTRNGRGSTLVEVKKDRQDSMPAPSPKPNSGQ